MNAKICRLEIFIKQFVYQYLQGVLMEAEFCCGKGCRSMQLEKAFGLWGTNRTQ